MRIYSNEIHTRIYRHLCRHDALGILKGKRLWFCRYKIKKEILYYYDTVLFFNPNIVIYAVL